MTDEKRKRSRARRIVAAAGFAAGLLCTLLPHEYQAACSAIVSICTAGQVP